MNPLLDKDFLKQLDSVKHKEIFARLTSLNFIEMPIEQIEGKITGGSINLDGKSSSRRTCNLTMVAKEVNINEFYWGLTHKIKIEIGVVNTINQNYDDIIWFNQGIFIISTFNVSLSVNNYTITLNAKDKMSLLNGDLGGNLFAQTDFANIENIDNVYEIITFKKFSDYEANKYYEKIIDYEEQTEKFELATGEYDDKKIYYEKFTNYAKESLPIKLIIKEMIHTYAKEPYFNIIINDLDDSGVELLEYRGSDPLYFIYEPDTDDVINMTMNGDMEVYIKTGNEISSQSTLLKNLSNDVFDKGVDSMIDLTIPYIIFKDDRNVPKKEYRIRKTEFGQTAGFRAVDLTYVGELIGNVGETLTSVLDKIKNMLGDFEYFYDIDGHFIFQRQKTYENQSWTSVVKTEDNDILIEDAVENSAVTYSFIDNNIITAFNNAPNLSNLRNDFSIWGVRKGVSGADIPIHLRYAIDTKPTFYKSFDGHLYFTGSSEYDSKRNSIIEYYENQIAEIEQQKQEVLDSINNYQKKPNPNGLPETWWNVLDWAEKYKLLTGHYPEGILSLYSSSTDNFNPNNYFREPTYGEYYNYCNTVNRPLVVYAGNATVNNNGMIQNVPFGLYTYDSSTRLSVFDVNSDGTLGYFGHGSLCGHSYEFFLENKAICGTISYIYNPEFPEADVQDFEDQIEELQNKIQETMESELQYYIVCDWREIIYQMAKDYYKHNQEDNFYSTLQNNNGKNLDGSYYYPNGITGYEQYYTDMISFWRDLYNLDPDRNYQTFGGYYAEYIDWTQANNFTYEIQTQWVGFEKDIGLFETQYFLPDDEKIYSDNMAQKIVSIKNTKIKLLGNIVDENGNDVLSEITDDNKNLYLYTTTNKGKLSWSIDESDQSVINNFENEVNPNRNDDGIIQGLKYEIYRSFYPTSGYYKIYPYAGSTNTIIPYNSGGNSYIEKDPLPFGSVNRDLPMYYKIRGYYTIKVGNDSPQIIYTQWSNRVNIVYHIDYDLDDQGERIEGDDHKVIYPIDIHTLLYTDSDRVPVVNIVAYQNNFPGRESYYYWNKDVFEAPEKLNFWFDFLDSDSELAQYKVSVVGDRTKAVNDTKVTSIYFKETPEVILYTNDEYMQHERKSGYVYFRINNEQKNLFSISTQYKSAKDVLDELLYNHSYCIESINITALPVYYLEPNTRIFVYDEDSQINGEYIISKITLPLTYNGTMSITATKAVDRLY